MSATRPLRMVGMNGPPADGAQGVLHVSRLVEGVRVEGDLHPRRLGDGEARVDGSGSRSPVLMQLEPGRPAVELLPQGRFAHGVALAEQGHVDREQSSASSIRARYHDPGVTVVALVPSAGPVPPPISVVIPTRSPLR